MQHTLDQDGRIWLRGAVDAAVVEHLREIADIGQRPGARVDASEPLFQAVCALPAIRHIAQTWPGMRPVRLVSFNKSGQSNWAVPWHQDRVISVARQCDLPGYANWSLKVNIWHCELPLELLERMLFLRLHLDPSTVENGAMQIALGSHHHGHVAANQAEAVANSCTHELTLADPGDILELPMLTLHRSGAAQSGAGRAVLRIDLSADDPAPPVQWAT